jgi:predicted secreted Zn-dependent protease
MATNIGAIEWSTYSVSGQTLADVAAAIGHLPEAGQTTWPATFDYAADANGTITSATVTVRRLIHCPQWDGYSSASTAAQSERDRFSAALHAHETGHSDLVEQYLKYLDQHLVGQPATQAQTIFDNALHALQAASDAYDVQTNHGQNTGTVIDTSIDAPTP